MRLVDLNIIYIKGVLKQGSLASLEASGSKSVFRSGTANPDSLASLEASGSKYKGD